MKKGNQQIMQTLFKGASRRKLPRNGFTLWFGSTPLSCRVQGLGFSVHLASL